VRPPRAGRHGAASRPGRGLLLAGAGRPEGGGCPGADWKGGTQGAWPSKSRRWRGPAAVEAGRATAAAAAGGGGRGAGGGGDKGSGERVKRVDGFALLQAAEAELPEEVVAANLSKKGLSDVEAEDLAFFTGLQILDLSDNRLAAVAPLAALPQLRQLYVQGNALQGGLDLPPGAFGALETLDLSFNALGPEALRALTDLPRLKKLDLGGNTALGAAFPAELPGGVFPALEELGLAACGFSGPALCGLAGLARLRALDLGGNPGVEAWPAECARAGCFSSLRSLDVSVCGVAIIEHLEGAWRLPKLTELVAWGNSGCVLRGGRDFREEGCQVVLTKPGGPSRRPNLRQFYGDKSLPPMPEDVSLGRDLGFAFLEHGDIEAAFTKIGESLEDFGDSIAKEDALEARQFAPPPSSSSEEDDDDDEDESSSYEGGGSDGGGRSTFLTSVPGRSPGGARRRAKEAAGGLGAPGEGDGEVGDPTLELAQLLGVDPRRLTSHAEAAGAPARLGTDATASINALRFALQHPLIRDNESGAIPAYQKPTASAEARNAGREAQGGARKAKIHRAKTIESLMDDMKTRLDTLRAAVDSAKRVEQKMERAMEGGVAGGSPAGGADAGVGASATGSADKGGGERPERAAAAALGYA